MEYWFIRITKPWHEDKTAWEKKNLDKIFKWEIEWNWESSIRTIIFFVKGESNKIFTEKF